MIDKQVLRLELLKLTYAHGRTPAEAVERARLLEAFAVEKDPTPAQTPKVVEQPKGKPGRPKKIVDNSDLLS